MSNTIVLIRHGQPTILLQGWIGGRELPQFVSRYQAAGIAEGSLPSEDVKSLVRSAKAVFTSDLLRAVHSAKILEPTVTPMVDPIFREAEFWFEFPINLRLPCPIWIGLAKLLWGLGYSGHCESLLDANNRAKKAAELLEQRSHEVSTVVLVGHGLTNLLITRELRKRGWRGSPIPNFGNWGCTTYHLALDSESN